ncbi:unnamed protein product [Miscanthus lutarioriparius]|uniref:TORTIFOLIA1/SINE1-2 N-terminal domain-containing protein n=1 Tax=Miscanthus lutarioriparius TaxID=422564 RepID=A0A811QDV6_9POAL|nr:unnamed protein product [Miscanthus lutarioriparius]
MAIVLSKSAVKSHPRSPTTAQPPPLLNPGSSATSAGGGAAPQPPLSVTTGAVPSKNAAMVELRSRVLTALAKLSDRDTHHIAVEELDRIIRAPPSTDAVPMLLNALASNSPRLASPARRESLRLLATICASHPDAAAPHLHKVLADLARRLKDPVSDTSVRDACRDVVGQLAVVYLRPLSASGIAEVGNCNCDTVREATVRDDGGAEQGSAGWGGCMLGQSGGGGGT